MASSLKALIKKILKKNKNFGNFGIKSNQKKKLKMEAKLCFK
jgi:hypothetical protein